jgi:nucleoporin POM152
MMKYESEQWISLEEQFTSSRGKIQLQPEERGRYQYLFTKISDAHYKNVDIIGAELVEQTVRPLALAQFTRLAMGRNGRLEVSSCEGTSVEVDVELKVRLIYLLDGR